MRKIFALTSVVFLLVLAVSPAKNALREYRSRQREYRSLGAARAHSLKAAQAYAERPVAIQQIWLPGLQNRVDRCTSCHLGVADPLMADARQPFRAHPRTAHTPGQFERLGCTVCHGGQGPATAADEAHGTALDAGPPMLPARYAEAGCGHCHGGTQVPEAPTLSRGRALMEAYSCFACHSVRGSESFRSPAPPLATLPAKTGAGWVRRWLKGPRAIDPNTRMPRFELADAEIEELTQYLFAQAVPPELEARIRAAAAEPPGDAAQGKKLFAESRCITCHTVEGKGNGSAPELSIVATSASRGWLLAFVRDPQAFHPATRMPRFAFTDTESRDLVDYMEADFRDFDAKPEDLVPPRINQTVAERGASRFRSTGCVACHAEGGRGEKFGPDLDGIGDKPATSLDFGRRGDIERTLPAWLAAKLDAPRSFADGLRMPAFELKPDEVQAVVTALLSLSAEPVPAAFQSTVARPEAMLPGGRVGALVSRYRCLSCHQIGAQGGDVSTAPLAHEGSKVQRDWLIDYLSLSYSLRPVLEERMPVLRMPREDATALADAIGTFYVDPAIPDDPFADHPAADRDPVEGEHLYATLGCRGCHIVGDHGGYVGPPLSDDGRRLRPGWVYFWLKGPQRWRADVRCPNYGLTDDQALRLTAYITSLRAAPAPAAPAVAASGGHR